MSPRTLECPPILLIAFNRPELTRRALAEIRQQRPGRLYFAVDGPRDPSEHPRDVARCKETRELAATVDWPCEVFTRFSDHNQGCGRGASNAIGWFFERVESGIVLEDDCLPDKSFFPYCAELLERFRDRPEVMHICGNNFGSPLIPGACRGASYGYGRFAQVWGWASWARAWQHFRFNVTTEVEDFGHFNIRGVDRILRRVHQTRVRSTTGPARLDSWGYPWQFAVLRNGGVCVVPSTNLISNLGFGEDATHTVNADAAAACIPLEQLSFPLIHPPAIADNPAINRIYAAHMLGDAKRHRRKKFKAWLRRITGRNPNRG